MNNIFVYIENEGGKAAEVCLELMTKGRELATTLGVKLEAVVLGENLAGIEQELARYGADTVWVADDKIFNPFRTLPHTAVMCGLIEQEKPQIALFGATCNGRDFAPRVSSALFSGLTADCTQLVIGDHKDAKTGTEYENLLYQIRPAFGGNIIATIVNPDHRPQMATVREGVMRKEYAATPGAGEVKPIDWKKFLKESDLVVKILDRQIEERKINIKGASVVVAGGYGVGSKENFKLIHELAEVLGGTPEAPLLYLRRYWAYEQQVAQAVAQRAAAWAREVGEDPLYRIVLCGYEGEHEMPSSWWCVPWTAWPANWAGAWPTVSACRTSSSAYCGRRRAGPRLPASSRIGCPLSQPISNGLGEA